MKHDVSRGTRYNQFTILSIAPPKRQPNGRSIGQLQVRCDCGSIIIRSRTEITSGKLKSCGHKP